MARLEPGQKVHLCAAGPWRDVVDSYRGSDQIAYAAADRTVWRLPRPCAVGDLVVVVLEARQRAVLSVEMLEQARDVDDLEDDAGALPTSGSEDGFTTGVSVPAVERRMGEPLPTAPCTLDDAYAERLLVALIDEELEPTPWVLADATGCVDGVGRELTDEELWTMPSLAATGCVCCHQPVVDLPFLERTRAMALHRVTVDDDPERHLGWDRVVQLCATCHALVHTPFGPTLEVLARAWNEPCPRCRSRSTVAIGYGMVLGPMPLGTEGGGCDISPTAPHFRCDECTFTWRKGYVEPEPPRAAPRARKPAPSRPPRR